MRPGALPHFEHLTSVPPAPFREKAVAAKAKHWIARHLGKRVSVREVRGGLIVSYRGSGAGPALALAAHLDHPAFRLDKITKDGAKALLQGGLPPHLLPGEAVEVFPAVPKDNVPLGRGVLRDLVE